MAGYYERRVSAYLRHTGRKVLTAAQTRRLRKKTNRRAGQMAAQLAWAEELAANFVEVGPPVESDPPEFVPDYSTRTRDELRAEAKARGLKGYSSLKKAELVALLTDDTA